MARENNDNHINIWQKSFYDRIIRNENELNKIREYIANNLLNWELDENFMKDSKVN